MRTFLALDISDRIKKEILNQTSEIYCGKNNELKWVTEENLHITLQFIGEVEPSAIPEIVQFLHNAFNELGKIKFKFSQIQLIPAKKPRLGWILLETENTEILKNIRGFRKFLQQLGYETENRKQKFHVTLFRIKKKLPDLLTNRILTTELKKMSFKVSSATLYESVLRPEGPNYYEIAKLKFTKE